MLAIKETEGVAPHAIHLYLALLSHRFIVARKQWGMEGLSNPTELVHKPRLPLGATGAWSATSQPGSLRSPPPTAGRLVRIEGQRRIELETIRHWRDGHR